MKKFPSVVSFLLILLAVYWSFESSMPGYKSDSQISESEFSTDRALKHVENISKKPHAVGFEAHAEVREYLLQELENLGLETQIQEGYTAGDWGNLSKAINILTRIEGSGGDKALLLLTHYDSSPHSSLGASDAGSGVATILEGIRAFLASGNKPVNDIIILFSDAEELGLNGADIFVNNHEWIEDVGLVLNFEARGSGGPSYMLIETNRGNGKLIEEFTEADPGFPVANSLAYSIYKLLPNDTDLTVFREDGDIEGFNFAFIDDHFDYHTANDSYGRLDPETLAHQGSYLMPLLNYFSQSDISDLKSLNDYIYFNLPFYRLVSYPFEWIWPMFAIGLIAFIIILVLGYRKKVLSLQGIALGFIPVLIILLINGVIGYYGWSVILSLYPEYRDMLHGFTYNGHSYIAAFVLLSLSICFFAYSRFRKVKTADLMVAPIVIWLLINGLLGVYLPGASFFMVPLLAMLASFYIVVHQEKPNLIILVLLAIPALWIHSPSIQMFPVGLGLKMIITSTLLTSLLFLLLVGIFGFYKEKHKWATLALLIAIGFFIGAHFSSGFDEDKPKPSSLLYVLNSDTGSAQWATYEKVPSEWTSQYIGDDRKEPEALSGKTISSKYSTGFTYVSDAPKKEIHEPIFEKSLDTVIGDSRILKICVNSQRKINRLEVFTNSITVESASVNGIELGAYYLKNRRSGKLITHYVSDEEDTEIKLSIPRDSILELTIYEASNDLLEHPQFSVPERPDDNIPMPFVLNDAVLITKTVRFE